MDLWAGLLSLDLKETSKQEQTSQPSILLNEILLSKQRLESRGFAGIVVLQLPKCVISKSHSLIGFPALQSYRRKQLSGAGGVLTPEDRFN